ncbi:serine/threonine-protein kinase [Nocardia cyriacigeorgica]|uniref:serine/threonine-protein kinase n=1 Tax=Nocardia cyriacigeorgica TaxID=135487 RepID=UPI0024537CBD|nr:serine/threonine-protein kinase [Nocardia cyriacigeorgica]
MLGQGGMGSVYLARHPRLDKQTALKLLNRDLFADASVRARFEREADLAAQLDHPSIVAVYDRGTEADQQWISMQYIDGADASSVNALTLPPERAVQIIDGVAEALDYAHGIGVLHRDVKPANVLLARSGGGHGERVFLTDFGLARLRAETTQLTQQGMFTATLAFASPEQMTGSALDPRSDQYSLACTLYWLLTGMAPFDSPNPADIIHGNLQLAAPPLAVKRRGLSPALDAVLAVAMAKHPAHRFATCAEFAAAARHALGNPAYQPVPTRGAPPAAYAGYPAAPAPHAGAAPAGVPMPQYPQPGTPGHPDAPTGQGTAGASTPGAGNFAAGADAPRVGDGIDTDSVGGDTADDSDGVGGAGGSDDGSAHPTTVTAYAGAGGSSLLIKGEQVQPVPADAGAAAGVGSAAAPTMAPPQGQPQQPPADGGGQGYGAPVPPYGPNHGLGHRFPVKRGASPAMIAIFTIIGLLVVLLVLAVVVIVLGGEDGEEGSVAGSAASTFTPAKDITPQEDPVERSRRIFPSLLPQGTAESGQGYQGAMCTAYEPDDQVRIEDDALSSRPWQTVWECRRRVESDTHMNYTIVVYKSADDARAVLGELPPSSRSTGAKSGAPYTAYHWIEPEPPGPLTTTHMVVGFGGGDPIRANALLTVGYVGPIADEFGSLSGENAVLQWWADAPL